MTKKLFSAMTIAGAFIVTPALAADMPIKAPLAAAPSMSTVSTWTGCYVNGGVGYGFGANANHIVQGGVTTLDQTTGGRGWLGTVGGGCDYQFSNNFVVGLLADYSFTDIHGDLIVPLATIGRDKQSSAAAAGGRVGFLVTPQIMAYVNGGWTSAKFDTVNLNLLTGTPLPFFLPSHTFSGAFFGGGTEVAVQALPGLYWRSEYRYSTYGSTDLQVLLGGTPIGITVHETRNAQTITTALIYKFH